MRAFYLILFSFLTISSAGQDSIEKKDVWVISGYIKDLQILEFDKDLKNAAATQLIHNRINLKWMPAGKLSGRLELRNRLYWGDQVRQIPAFEKGLRNNSEAVDLSYTWIKEKNAVLHSNVERFWIEYKRPKMQVRAGRQRINWGIANTWNPNDLFNSYNFLDVDYEERPGSDAVNMKFLTSDLSGVELAAAYDSEKVIALSRYFTNYKNYDLHWIAGIYGNAITAGMGWAGSIGEAGFKGEAQFYGNSKNDNESSLLIVMEGDYIFKNGWYLGTSFLYNQRGIDSAVKDLTQLDLKASPHMLMPTKWNMIFTVSKEFTPLFNGSMNLVYAPGPDLLIVFPSLKYNLLTNLDLDLVWQSFFARTSEFNALAHTGFFRVKWSF